MARLTTSVVTGKIGAKEQPTPRHVLSNVLQGVPIVRPILSHCTTIHASVTLRWSPIDAKSPMHSSISLRRFSTCNPRISSPLNHFRIPVTLEHLFSLFVSKASPFEARRNFATPVLGNGTTGIRLRKSRKVLPVRLSIEKRQILCAGMTFGHIPQAFSGKLTMKTTGTARLASFALHVLNATTPKDRVLI